MSRTMEDGYANGRARREQIVQTAMQLFARTGFNGSTMRDIAAAVGISRAGLTHHFPTKEALLEAVLEARDTADRESFRRSGAGAPGGLGVLRGMVDLATRNAEVPGIIALYVVLSAEATSPDHPAHDYYVQRYERIRQGTQTALERAEHAGYLNPDVDPAIAATELTALMDGLQLMWVLAPTKIDMAGQLRVAIERLLAIPLYQPREATTATAHV